MIEWWVLCNDQNVEPKQLAVTILNGKKLHQAWNYFLLTIKLFFSDLKTKTFSVQENLLNRVQQYTWQITKHYYCNMKQSNNTTQDKNALFKQHRVKQWLNCGYSTLLQQYRLHTTLSNTKHLWNEINMKSRF